MFSGSSNSGLMAGAKPTAFQFGSSSNNTTNPNTSFGGSAGSGFSLGGNNANSTSGFGSKPVTAGFGGPPNTNTNNMNISGTSGGLFGSCGTQVSTSSTGGVFGNTSTTPAGSTVSGGLFGSSGGSNAPAGANSHFDGNSATSTAPNTTSTFGKPTLASTSFGGSDANSTAQKTTSGGLFGSTAGQIQPQPATGGGLFGNTATTTGNFFGGQQQHNNTFGNDSTSLFGNANKNFNNAQPSFSWSNNHPQNPSSAGELNISNLSTVSSAKTQENTSHYTPSVHDQVMKLKDRWDPRSTRCALKTYVYNKFSEAEIAVLLEQPKPADATPEEWENAMASRPSPMHFPVKVTSFSEVAQRVESQLEHVAKSRVFLNSIHEKSMQLSSQRDLDTTTRIAHAKARHTKLSRRLLQLATTLAVIKLRGYPLLPEEEEISRQFHTLHASLSDPRGSVGSLSDLYARLAILKRRSEELSSSLESQIHTMSGGLDTVANTSNDPSKLKAPSEQVVESLTKLLYKQQMGLGYLNDVIQKDISTVEKAVKK